MKTKKCNGCGRALSITAFGTNGTLADGSPAYRPRCKGCRAEDAREARKSPEVRQREAAACRKWHAQNRQHKQRYDRAYYAENADRMREKSRRWAAENPEKAREIVARRRARKVAATIEDFTASDVFIDWADHDLWQCFFCAGPLEPLHVEHFEPLSRGGAHVLYNLVPSCGGCNLSKGAGDPWAFLASALEQRGIDLDECLKNFT